MSSVVLLLLITLLLCRLIAGNWHIRSDKDIADECLYVCMCELVVCLFIRFRRGKNKMCGEREKEEKERELCNRSRKLH